MSTRPYARAFSSLGAVELTLDETLALATRHQLNAVELRGLGGSLDVPAWLAKTYGTPEAFAAHARQSPIRIVALDTSLRLIGNTSADRDAFLQFIPWAEALGIPRLRIFDGGSKAGLTEADLAQALETLAWWNGLRRENGWRTDFMIETHDALITTPAIRRFLAQAPTGTSLLWDAHHTWKLGGESPVDTWKEISSSVVHIHVKDSIPVPSGNNAYTYALPGTGDFPMASLRTILEQDGYASTVSLEWERHWHPKIEPLEDALTSAASHRWW
ncbi:sugar phosphate isomerase/epimerase family protein [Rariglobus hedericola]|uniref:Sugar phosphate isomerase/epimerase n=1 Tax=Rariglobus hedericola TaxID=2597822 RepID=A0A556QMU6_9BACT|nr:TIM barrel protein [Rariglobus hedericola]TSJ77954.1 sugar phosphate isomerase/epimerase [Rariglobus hedericola]